MPRKTTGRKSTAKSKPKSTTRSAARSTTKRRTTTAKPKGGKSAGSKSTGGKVGGSRAAARKFAGKGDFGIPASNRRVARGASEKTKKRPSGDRNPDDRQPRAGVGSREAGVGMREAGPGSSSGGDVDTDVVGLPDARGLAQSGPDDQDSIREAETTGGSEEFASGPPARGENQPARTRQPVQGATHDRGGGDATTTDTSAPGTVGHTQANQFGAGHADISGRSES